MLYFMADPEGCETDLAAELMGIYRCSTEQTEVQIPEGTPKGVINVSFSRPRCDYAFKGTLRVPYPFSSFLKCSGSSPPNFQSLPTFSGSELRIRFFPSQLSVAENFPSFCGRPVSAATLCSFSRGNIHHRLLTNSHNISHENKANFCEVHCLTCLCIMHCYMAGWRFYVKRQVHFGFGHQLLEHLTACPTS